MQIFVKELKFRLGDGLKNKPKHVATLTSDVVYDGILNVYATGSTNGGVSS